MKDPQPQRLRKTSLTLLVSLLLVLGLTAQQPPAASPGNVLPTDPCSGDFTPVELWDPTQEPSLPPDAERLDIDLGDPPEEGLDWTLELSSVREFKLAPPQHEIPYEYGQDYCGGVRQDPIKGDSRVSLRFFAPGFYRAKAVSEDPGQPVRIIWIRVGVTELSGSVCDPLVGGTQTVTSHTQTWTGTGTFAMVANDSDLDRAMNIYPSAVRVGSLNDIQQAAQNAFQANGNQRVRAILVAHGSIGSFSVGNSRFRMRNGALSADAVALGAIRNHVDHFEIIACCLAYGVADSGGQLVLQHFLPQFVPHLNRTVYAYDRTIGIALRFQVGGRIIRESYMYAHVPLLGTATWYTLQP